MLNNHKETQNNHKETKNNYKEMQNDYKLTQTTNAILCLFQCGCFAPM